MLVAVIKDFQDTTAVKLGVPFRFRLYNFVNQFLFPRPVVFVHSESQGKVFEFRELHFLELANVQALHSFKYSSLCPVPR